MRKMCVLFWVVSSIAIWPSHGLGQSAQADSLTEFVEVLLTGMMIQDGRPTLRLAQLPPSVPHFAVPEGAEVVGSIEYATFSMSVIRAADASDVIFRVRGDLEDKGWTYKAEDVAAGFTFEPARTSAMLCSDGHYLGFGAKDSSYIFVMHATNPMIVAQCNAPVARDLDNRPRSPIPQMPPPPGVQARQGGSSGGGDSWTTSIRLMTDMPVQQIMSHYTWQLQQAGAVLGMQSVARDVSYTPFQLTDTDGSVWQGAITVVAAASADRVVYLQLVR